MAVMLVRKDVQLIDEQVGDLNISSRIRDESFYEIE